MQPLVIDRMRLVLFVSLLLWGISTSFAQQKIDVSVPLVNQAGYNLNESKHFVFMDATSAYGTPFRIINVRTGESEYSGLVLGQEGWFGDFNPSSGDEYVIEVNGKRSVPFSIGDHYIERISSKLAYDFFIDARGSEDPVHSNEKNVYGGGPTRDCGAFGLEALFEILFYSSNPALFDNWCDEMDDKGRADLIDLILWHAEFAYNHVSFNERVALRHGTLGYPGQPRMEYDYWNTLDQLAPVCAAYHLFLKPYLEEEKYQAYRQACLDHWTEYDRHKVVRYWTYSNKWVDRGFQEFNEMGNAFGQSVFSNLFMYLCEKNEPDGHPEQFLEWARESAADIIRNWDFNNPRHTWWIRNAEHITPQALEFFLLVAPEQAPEGTLEKLEAWSHYIKQRTNNPWRYRSHSDVEMAHERTKELGSAPALPGAMFAASYLLNDSFLRQIAWAEVDFVFGANPCGAHFGHKSKERVKLGYWEGVENGWIASHPNGFGQLGLVRGTLDGTPLNSHFPEMKLENPKKEDASQKDNIGVAPYATEGWGISNRGWMATLTFSTLGTHSIRFLDKNGNPVNMVKRGEEVIIELKAALNIDYNRADDGWVELKRDNDAPVRISVKETGPNTGLFRAVYEIPRRTRKVSVSYGYFGFGVSSSLVVR